MSGVHRGGGAAVLITHKLDEALARGGPGDGAAARRVVLDRRRRGTGPRRARRGDDRRARGTAGGRRRGAPATDRHRWCRWTRSTSRARAASGSRVRDASLAVRAGEIVGIAAVEGNGQRELLRAVAGRIRPLRGGSRSPTRWLHSGGPDHRRTHSGDLAHRERGARAGRPGVPGSAAGRIGLARGARTDRELLEEYGGRRAGPGLPAAALSGGNQQKLVVARELSRAAGGPRRGEPDARARHPRRGGRSTRGSARPPPRGGGARFTPATSTKSSSWPPHRGRERAARCSRLPPGASRAEIGALMLGGAW